MRIIQIEEWQSSFKNEDVTHLIKLLKDVSAALRVFVKCGNALKWLAGIVIAIAAITATVRHVINGQ